jgi:hypothetical protein
VWKPVDHALRQLALEPVYLRPQRPACSLLVNQLVEPCAWIWIDASACHRHRHTATAMVVRVS